MSFGGGRKSRELDSTMLLTDLHLAAVEEPAEDEENNAQWALFVFDLVFTFLVLQVNLK